jgi:HK97 gp10 family phage protein
MKVNLDYKECTYSIEQQIAKIPEGMEREKKSILNKSAKLLKKTIEESFKNMESDVSPGTTNYDGSLPYLHMADDVKTSIKDDKAGNVYAIIRGGKYTGYKWHMLENGTSSPDRPATHFIDKALKQTESEINSYIDEAIGRAVQGGN